MGDSRLISNLAQWYTAASFQTWYKSWYAIAEWRYVNAEWSAMWWSSKVTGTSRMETTCQQPTWYCSSYNGSLSLLDWCTDMRFLPLSTTFPPRSASLLLVVDTSWNPVDSRTKYLQRVSRRVKLPRFKTLLNTWSMSVGMVVALYSNTLPCVPCRRTRFQSNK